MDRYESMVRSELLRELRRLDALINTPELVDFAKAVRLESVHQEQRWGRADRDGKTPGEWHWLVAHLAGRALSHSQEAKRLQGIVAAMPVDDLDMRMAFGDLVAHHREKALHHTITTAAALAHWHASMMGKRTATQAGHGPAIRDLGEMAVWSGA